MTSGIIADKSKNLLRLFTDGRNMWMLHQNYPKIDMDDVVNAVIDGKYFL
jgi:hypothetical protein